ncbi:MAG: FCD domain-containing protein [Kofleriaceae bacterium]
MATFSEEAYGWLRQRILDGTFEAGEKLRVEHLREQAGIGATPIREALARLSAERLVLAIGQRGFRVAPVSLAELEDVTTNRVMLETRAVELSVKQGDLAWEAALVASHHLMGRAKGTFADWDKLNAGFHDALVAACGSPWLMELRKMLFDQHTRYRALAAATTKRTGGRDVAREHDAIVEAALARQHRRCAELVEDHIRETATVLHAQLAKQLAA